MKISISLSKQEAVSAIAEYLTRRGYNAIPSEIQFFSDHTVIANCVRTDTIANVTYTHRTGVDLRDIDQLK